MRISSPADTKLAAPHAMLLRMAAVLQTLDVDYQNSATDGVSAAIVDPRLAAQVRSRFEEWQAEGVQPLHVALIDSRSVGTGRAVGTVQFSSDARAIPQYMVFHFRRRGAHTVIDGLVSGLRGTTYATANWQVTRSPHFSIYHSPYQLQGVDRAALSRLENQRTLFERRFGVKVAPLTQYYLYPQQSLMSPMTESACGASPQEVGCAFALNKPPMIHTSEWPSYHEPVHVYERALEPQRVGRGGTVYVAPLFIAEGTAVALEDRELDPRLSDYCSDLTYIPLDACAQAVAGRVDPLTRLSDAGFRKGDIADSYVIGGSFVKYLILQYGYRRFGRFYYVLAAQPSDSRHDYDVATRAVFGRSIEQLLVAWRDQLCAGGC